MLRQLAALGECAPGLTAVQVSDDALVYSDNPHDSTKPVASSANPAYTGSLTALSLQAVLVRVNNAATLERARTYLAVHAPPQVSSGPGTAATPPRTYREAVAIRSKRAQVAQNLFDLAVTLTVVVAGLSLVVSIGGGLVDRKRPFTLLRVGGTPLSTLSRVVLLEAVLPLAAAVVAAAGIAYGMAVFAVLRLVPAGHAGTRPERHLLGDDGGRHRHRAGSHLRDAATARPHDHPLQRPLRVTDRPARSIASCRLNPSDHLCVSVQQRHARKQHERGNPCEMSPARAPSCCMQ